MKSQPSLTEILQKKNEEKNFQHEKPGESWRAMYFSLFSFNLTVMHAFYVIMMSLD